MKGEDDAAALPTKETTLSELVYCGEASIAILNETQMRALAYRARHGPCARLDGGRGAADERRQFYAGLQEIGSQKRICHSAKPVSNQAAVLDPSKGAGFARVNACGASGGEWYGR